MKRHMKKKIALFACGVGAVVILLSAYLYLQWRDTQALFYESPTTESQGVTSQPTEPVEETAPTDEVEELPDEPLPTAQVEPTPSPTVEPTEAEVEPTDTPQPEETTEPTATPTPTVEESEADRLVAEAVTVLSGYETEFLTALEALYSSATADYQALPEEEQTKENRDKILLGYAIEGLNLEADCDTVVNALLADLTADLEAIGESADVVATLQESYTAKKAAKQSEYLNMVSS